MNIYEYMTRAVIALLAVAFAISQLLQTYRQARLCNMRGAVGHVAYLALAVLTAAYNSMRILSIKTGIYSLIDVALNAAIVGFYLRLMWIHR